MTITLDDYFAAYAGHSEITAEMQAFAADLLDRVNALREEAEADGVVFQLNPATGTYISGQRNGGWRPSDCPIGAPSSAHKQAKGVDNFDPTRRFASWCMAHHDRLRHHGLTMERPEWTPTWVHLQSRPVASGVVAFVPSKDPPMVGPVPVWA